MAKKNRQLPNAFETLTVIQNEEESQQQDNSPETSQEAPDEVVVITEDDSIQTISDITQRFKDKYEEKANRKTVEDTHVRTTFLFRKDLAKRLDKLSKNKRGYKTEFFNTAIEALLDDIERR